MQQRRTSWYLPVSGLLDEADALQRAQDAVRGALASSSELAISPTPTDPTPAAAAESPPPARWTAPPSTIRR